MEKQGEHGLVVDAMEIMEILPHRYPMLLIDTVLEYKAGVYTVAKKQFTYGEAYFQGHYPENPIVPGTILLEGLSQTATFAILSGEKRGGQSALYRSKQIALFQGGRSGRLRYLQGGDYKEQTWTLERERRGRIGRAGVYQCGNDICKWKRCIGTQQEG